MPMSLSAIIVNYHCSELTSRAVASVLADCSETRVVVVDNSACPEEFRDLQAALPFGVECLRAQENLGFGKACNLGYSRTASDWVLLLNPDALILKGCLGKLVEFLRDRPRAGAVAPLAWWDEDRQWLLPPAQMPTPLSELTMALALRLPWFGRAVSRSFRHQALRTLLSGQPVRQRMLSGGHILLRRTAVDAAGGLFDPEFFMYYEDTDFCRRLAGVGFEMYLLPSAQAIHKWCASSAKQHLSLASRQHYFEKHFSGSRLSAWRDRLANAGAAGVSLPDTLDLGEFAQPPRFNIPREISSSWVVEVSPHPLLTPASYHFGEGDSCDFPLALWNCLGPGSYWARVGSRSGGRSLRYHWRVSAPGGSK